MKASKALVLEICVVAVVAGAVLYMVGRSETDPAGPVSAVRLGVQDNVICALPFIAAEEGFFEDHGLAVEVKRYPSGKLALNAFLAGEVDMATVADMPIMARSFERSDFAVFATIASTEQGAWILANRAKGISVPADLRGKRVATQRNSAVHFFLSMFLLKHGIGDDEIDAQFMKAVDLPAALAEERIDAFSMRNPFIRQAKELLGDKAVEMFDSDVYRQTFNLVAMRADLEANRETMEQVLKALADAERLVIRDEEKAMAAAAAQLGVGRETETRADWGNYTFSLTLDQSLFITLEDQARWAMSQDPDVGSEIPNYFDFVDIRPMEAVKPNAVSIIR